MFIHSGTPSPPPRYRERSREHEERNRVLTLFNLFLRFLCFFDNLPLSSRDIVARKLFKTTAVAAAAVVATAGLFHTSPVHVHLQTSLYVNVQFRIALECIITG